MKTPFRTLVAGLLAASTLSAFAGGTITNGSASLQFVGNPIFSTGTGDANLTFTGITDIQQRYTWYYRSPGNTNRIFSSLDTPSEVYSGNTATITYTNAGPGASGVARFNAMFTIVLTSPSPGVATVTTTLVFTAAAANTAAQTFNLFNAVAFDLGPTGANNAADVYSVVDPNAIRLNIADSASSNFAQYQGNAADRYELFSTGSALNTKLSSGTADLTNAAGSTATSVSSAAGGAAMQFTRTLAPGQSTTITTVYTINTPIPEPSTWALLGFGAVGVLAHQRRRLATLLKRS